MKAAYADNFVTAYCGDALDVMRGLPAASVHCCVTSPPYWGLRDYGQGGQLGLERTPEEYVERMVEYFQGVKRLLRKDGTCWLNLGDSYATGAGKVSTAPGGGKQGAMFKRHFGKNTASPATQSLTQPNRMPLPGLKAKDMVGIPWRVAFALQADGWYLRSEIIWNKPNPMPESVTDRPTKSHETIFLLSRSPRYYYDAEAIKDEVTGNAHGRGNGVNPKAAAVPGGWKTGPGRHDDCKVGRYGAKQNPSFSGSVKNPVSRRNKRSVWTVATQPYPGAHYATFPPKLILPCILAGTSERGCCPKCGAPWRRVVESKKHFESGSGKSGNPIAGKNGPECQGGDTGDIRKGPVLETKTVGWKSGCKCGGEAEPCVVLDPFGGSGTTGQVARETGRKAILIELNPEDIELRMKERFKQELLPLGAGMSRDVPECPKGK